MNIVLLGATGFVGHHLVPRLARAGHHLTVLTRNRAQRRDLAVNPNTRLVQADVHDTDALAECLQGADAAVNMVGILNERGRDGSGFEKAHVETVEALIAACRAAGVHRIVQVSALNAGKGESHYLRTKGEAEARLREAQDLEVTILQPSVIFGPGDGFFNRFATLLALAPVMPLACPGARLQPVHVDDVCEALERALEDRALAGRTLELAGPRVYTLRELVALTAKFKGYRRRIVGLPGGLSRLQAAVMDFVPGKPFSTDNYRSLQVDNVAEHNALPELGIAPKSVECFVPDYLCGSRRQRHLQDLRRHAGR